MSNIVQECSKDGCPFACTENSEVLQNHNCLLTPKEIIEMKLFHGKFWACHSDPTKPCLGAINRFMAAGLVPKIKPEDLITINDVEWRKTLSDSTYKVFL